MTVNPTLPTVGGDVGAWGPILNEALTELVTAINAATTTLGGKAATVHTHTESDVSSLAADLSALSAAVAGRVPTSRQIVAGAGMAGGGDLSADRMVSVVYGTTAGTAAQGNDARLSDARTPTAHASSHASGGTDAVTLAQSQVTGLTTALAGKAASTHTHAESDVSSLVSDLAGKATANHTHSASDITGLPSEALTPANLHATYGDHFTGSSLDAKWTRVTYTSGDEAYQQGNGSWLAITPRAAGAYYFQAATPGSAFVLVGKFIVNAAFGSFDFGLLAVDASGNGAGCAMHYASGVNGVIAMRLTGGAFNTTYQATSTGAAGSTAQSGMPVWIKLAGSSGTYTAAYSLNGQLWSESTSGVTPPAFTVARIGFGSMQGTVVKAAIDFFDVQ